MMTAPVRGARLETVPARRGVGLRGVPAPGAHAGVVAWDDRAAWLAGVRLLIDSHADAGVLRSPVRGDAMSADLLMRVIELVTATADTATGRDGVACRARIARQLGCVPKTVQRACRLACRVLGVLVRTGEGRLLRLHGERRRMIESGASQRGLSSVYAAHTPAHLRACIALARRLIITASGQVMAAGSGKAVDHVPHPGGPQLSPHLPLSSTHLEAPRAARPPKTTRGQGNPRRAAGVTGPGRALGAALAREIASRVPWGHRLRPRAVAAHLAPYAAAGWTAAAWLAAVEQGYRDRGWTPPAVVTSPGGLVHHWCQTLDPAALDTTTGELHRPQPCGRPGCDHGWLTTTDVMGRVVAAPCPHCPPIVRTSAWQAETDRIAEETPDVQDPAAADEVCPTIDDGDAALEVQDTEDAEDGDGGLLERVEAAWTAVLTQHTPLDTWEHTDPAVWRALHAETVASRRALYAAAGWGPEQVAAVDPTVAHRTHALARLAARTKRVTRARRG
ncbi:hypothetical protein [Arsenicicoccus dermatophilus]|uniref:hypothetical protein n=1 Tax=Arsenicicoccus dermatophilus TaxID=1076331 RepID=UPI0039171F38